jgi:uncharacterized membrane protein YdjX (TVP38/TMEM64 family)
MHRRRLVLLLVVVGLLVAASTLEPVQEMVDGGLEAARRIIRLHETLGLGLFVVLSAISAIFFFFSTAVIVPVAVYAWGKPATMLLLWASWLLGAAVSYWIGLRPGRRLATWLVPGKEIAQYENRISAKATFPLVLLFQLAVPSEIPGYVLGALRYHFGKYLAARAIAELPFAVGAVYLGDSFVRGQYLLLMVIATVGLALSAVALYVLRRRIDGHDRPER